MLNTITIIEISKLKSAMAYLTGHEERTTLGIIELNGRAFCSFLLILPVCPECAPVSLRIGRNVLEGHGFSRAVKTPNSIPAPVGRDYRDAKS